MNKLWNCDICEFLLSLCPSYIKVNFWTLSVLLLVSGMLMKDTSAEMWFRIVHICGYVSTDCVECGGDISIIIDIFTQKGTKCSRKGQFNSRKAHFPCLSSPFPLPILFPKPQRVRLVLFWFISSLCISISLSPATSLCAWLGLVPLHWLFRVFH